jgi:tetratricopeptide (TPR) repeat protein
MAQKTNSFEKFWQELKRRKVFGVVTTYAATAYIIIEVTNNLAVPLHLPDWVATLILIILLIGLPIIVILSWIFDFTPQGIKKTASIEELESKEIVTKPSKRKLRVSYVLNAILIIAVIVLAYPKIFKRNTLEKLRSSGERISVAVMPFQNMTNNTAFNIWQDGIRDELISSLSNNPEELQVRQPESINTLIKSRGLTNYASITPSIASSLSQKLEADVFISGNIKQAGGTIRLNAQLSDTKTKEVIKSFQTEGTDEDILHLIDSLSSEIQNYLVLSKIRKKLPYEADEFQELLTSESPEATIYVIQGRKAFYDVDFPAAIKLFSQALERDSNVIVAISYLSLAYKNLGIEDLSEKWLLKAYEKRDLMTMYQKAYIDWHYAVQFGTPQEQIMYCKQLLEFDDQDAGIYYILSLGYRDLNQNDKVINTLEKHLEIYDKWDSKPVWVFSYTVLGRAYHNMGMYKKEEKLYKKAELDFPDNQFILQRQIPLALTKGDTITGNQYIEKYISVRKAKSHPEANIITGIGLGYFDAGIFNKTEEYYRKALAMEPNSPIRMNRLAFLLIDKDRNIVEGIELVNKALELNPGNYEYLDCKGWGLYKQGKYNEALALLEKNWESMQPHYNHSFYLHLEAAKKAVAGLKNN